MKSGVLMMTKHLIFYRPEFRQAIRDGLLKLFGSTDWRVEYFDHLSVREETLMDKVYSTCIVDRLGVEHFGISVKNIDPLPPPMDYDPGDLSLLLEEKARTICDKNNPIDVFWSGGIDSTATLLLLNEWAQKDQIRVILSDGSIDEYPALFDKMVKHMPHVINHDMNIRSEITKDNITVFANEADTLYSCGSINDVSDENWDFYEKIRFGWCWRRYRNYEGYKHDRVLIHNCESLFNSWDVQSWFIGRHRREKQVIRTHDELVSNPNSYLQEKMELRDIIAKYTGDKEYAYTKPKVVSLLHGQKDFNNGHKNIVAVCSDGDIVLRQDLNKIDPLIYCHSEILEGKYE
jgi:hypothetical protein